MKKKILFGAVFLLIAFLCLPLFVSPDKTGNVKPALAAQLYSANPLTPYMQRFKRFLGHAGNAFAPEAEISADDTAPKTDNKNKKSALARAAARIKDAWKKSAEAVAPDTTLAENLPIENDADGENGYENLAQGRQIAPEVSAKGMHDIKTKAAYEKYIRNTSLGSPLSEEAAAGLPLLAGGKQLAVGSKTAAAADRFAGGGATPARATAAALAGRGGSAAYGGNSARTAAGNTGSGSAASRHRQAWQDIHNTIDSIARMRADAKYPNPKTDRERAARNQMIEREKAREIRAINENYARELNTILTQPQQAKNNTAQPYAPYEKKEGDISSLIMEGLETFRKTHAKEENFSGFPRSINNDLQDHEQNSSSKISADKEPIVVLGPEVKADFVALQGKTTDVWVQALLRRYDYILRERKCDENNPCLYVAKGENSNNAFSQDLATAVDKAGFKLNDTYSEQDYRTLADKFYYEVEKPRSEQAEYEYYEKANAEAEQHIDRQIARNREEYEDRLKKEIAFVKGFHLYGSKSEEEIIAEAVNNVREQYLPPIVRVPPPEESTIEMDEENIEIELFNMQILRLDFVPKSSACKKGVPCFIADTEAGTEMLKNAPSEDIIVAVEVERDEKGNPTGNAHPVTYMNPGSIGAWGQIIEDSVQNRDTAALKVVSEHYKQAVEETAKQQLNQDPKTAAPAAKKK